MGWLELVIVAGLSAGVSAYVMFAYSRRHLADEVDATSAEATERVESARLAARAASSDRIAEAKQKVLVEAEAAAKIHRDRINKLEAREARASAKADSAREHIAEIDERAADLDDRFAEAKARRDESRAISRRIRAERSERIQLLAAKAELEASTVAERLANTWLQDARTEASHAVRAIEQNAQDASYLARANRLLEIAVGRYRNHFLTERGISTLALGQRTSQLLAADGGRISEIFQEVANVTFNVAEDGSSLRLEGLDGVGREVARRALSRLNKKSEHVEKAKADPAGWATSIKTNLEREIIGLGNKAFKVLGIPRAHPEIVDLVGRLNYRTSYTQNQWLHAVEAAFLASMIGDEMGLDRKLLRRATLMHDIGKALTHKIEGSHAVIGADIARRLGEDERVANAIGAHHADEPPTSVFAFLVAGCDAMSGARPGARREHTEGYSGRLHDMERIGCRWRGVDRAFAVHGGRELRVYVEDNAVNDLEAVEMSQQIASAISDEMTFPGQIKVTVIRATESVSVAS